MHTQKLSITFIIILGLSSSINSFAQPSMLNNALGIMTEISTLADEFNLTQGQKVQMRSILMKYLPAIGLKANSMMNNRQTLLDSSLTNDEVDEELLQDIADRQGKILAELIVSKEYMKKELRAVLTEDQKGFVDALIQNIIQYKLDH